MDPSVITPQALVDDLFALLDYFEVERCIVAGESLGAVVILAAAHQRPEFDGIVLVDGVPAVAEQSVAPLIAGARHDHPATVAAFVEACVPESDSEHLKRWGRGLLGRATAEAAARLFECYLESGVRPTPLEEIAVPALVIHGTNDAIVPFSVGETMAARLSDATLVALEGAGHVPTVTRPDEVATAILERFGR